MNRNQFRNLFKKPLKAHISYWEAPAWKNWNVFLRIEIDSEANTVSGWVMERLGRIPNIEIRFLKKVCLLLFPNRKPGSW